MAQRDDGLDERLRETARRCRSALLRAVHGAGSGHPGGSLSATDLLTPLYFSEMRHDPTRPDWPARDRLVLCKGHAAPALYAVLAEAGYFPAHELSKLRQAGALLEGHPHRTIPGVDMTTGSLGQGLSAAAGMALGARRSAEPYRVYAIMGDGEQAEGQVWEAAMFSAHHGLDNLVGIIDYNKLQSDDFNRNIMGLEPLADKWRAFGWEVLELDGNDILAIRAAFTYARGVQDRPTLLLAHTIKGRGVSFMEGDPAWHGSRAPTEHELATALMELDADGSSSRSGGGTL